MSDAIEEQLAPFARAVEMPCTIPGIHTRTAQVIVARDRRRHDRLPDAQAAGLAGRRVPGNDGSAGRRRSGRTRTGSRWLGIAPTEAAPAATRTKHSPLAAHHQRLRPRRGHKRALGAVKHSMLTPIWHMLTTGEL